MRFSFGTVMEGDLFFRLGEFVFLVRILLLLLELIEMRFEVVIALADADFRCLLLRPLCPCCSLRLGCQKEMKTRDEDDGGNPEEKSVPLKPVSQKSLPPLFLSNWEQKSERREAED